MKKDVLAKIHTDSVGSGANGEPLRLDSPGMNRVLVAFNDTRHDFPRTKCLPELLGEQARARPDDLAVVQDGQGLTFRELTVRAQALAAYLQHLGVMPDECVGLFVEPSLELMVGAWGILFAGAAYLPVDPDAPAERERAHLLL